MRTNQIGALVVTLFMLVLATPMEAQALGVNAGSSGSVSTGASVGSGNIGASVDAGVDVSVGSGTSAGVNVGARTSGTTGAGGSGGSTGGSAGGSAQAVATLRGPSIAGNGPASANVDLSGETDVSSDAGAGADARADLRASAGITADSPLWGIDVILDDLRLALATDAETKTNVGLEIAEERAAEVKVAAEAEKFEAVQKSAQEHAKVLAEVRTQIEAEAATGGGADIEVGGTPCDVTVETGASGQAMADVETFVELQEKVAAHAAATEQVRVDLEKELESETHVTAEQKAVVTAFAEGMATAAADVKATVDATLQARAEERIMAAQQAVAEARAMVDVCLRTHAAAKAKANVNVDPTVAADSDTNVCVWASAQLDNADVKIDAAEQAFAQGDFGQAFGQATAALHIVNSASARAS